MKKPRNIKSPKQIIELSLIRNTFAGQVKKLSHRLKINFARAFE